MFACPLNQSLSTLTERIRTFLGQFIMERNHEVNAVSDPAVQEIYNKSHGH